VDACWVLNEVNMRGGDFFNACDFVAYKEKEMTKLERIEELEKNLAELKASVIEDSKV
jgi:hypothetical protein